MSNIGIGTAKKLNENEAKCLWLEYYRGDELVPDFNKGSIPFLNRDKALLKLSKRRRYEKLAFRQGMLDRVMNKILEQL